MADSRREDVDLHTDERNRSTARLEAAADVTHQTPGRQPPGPIGRRLARAPRYLYKLGLGRLLGRRFLLLHHTGRKTGRSRETVLEVVRHDPAAVDVAAAWGRKSDWFRNLQTNPNVMIDTGPLRRAPAVAEVVDPDAAATVFAEYARRHPRAARALASSLGLPFHDPDALAATVPLVRLTLQ